MLGRLADNGQYIKGQECVDSLKDLQQFLNRDDALGDLDTPIEIDEITRLPLPRRVPWELHRSVLSHTIFDTASTNEIQDPDIVLCLGCDMIDVALYLPCSFRPVFLVVQVPHRMECLARSSLSLARHTRRGP